MTAIPHFSTRLLTWFDEYGRKDLPWQEYADPYPIWLSEIMLQQTQVKTVIPYFRNFMGRFPSVDALASAPEDEVLHLWSGLGYYARARNLHYAAKQVVDEFGGDFPRSQEELVSLKGVGRSTAAAIRAQAYGATAAILDGNVKRVLARLYGIEQWPGLRAAETRMWQLAEALLPDERLRDYTQGLMDFGATLCVRSSPDCPRCPFQAECIAYKTDSVAELPVKKPKRAVPIKETTFLILRNSADEILLEKRPPTGIWGGLWSFPETAAENVENRVSELVDRFDSSQELEEGEHVFSHFRLRYQPLLIDLDSDQFRRVGEDQKYIWYSMAEPQNLGLAAPVSKLISQLQLRAKTHLKEQI